MTIGWRGTAATVREMTFSTQRVRTKHGRVKNEQQERPGQEHQEDLQATTQPRVSATGCGSGWHCTLLYETLSVARGLV